MGCCCRAVKHGLRNLLHMKKSNFKPIFILSVLIVVLFMVLLFLNVFPIQKIRIIGYSMYPALESGENINIDYDYDEISRGDIVAIKFKTRDEVLIKRVIALPQDKFEIKNNLIYLNGKLLNEPYAGDTSILQKQLKAYDNYVPLNSYIVLGDNRQASFDSSDFGIVDKTQIIGKAS